MNWPQIFKLINILACGLGFLCLIGFFLATQERFSWLLLSYLLLILNYHLILKEHTHSPPPIFTIILLPLPPVPPSSYFKSTHLSPPPIFTIILLPLFPLPPLWFSPLFPSQSRFLWPLWPQARHLTERKQRKRIN